MSRSIQLNPVMLEMMSDFIKEFEAKHKMILISVPNEDYSVVDGSISKGEYQFYLACKQTIEEFKAQQ